mmetsp:Transcript_28565/g.57277  ORF Transcript_28565/g.57277 Transcript_28565/m.57277 type:complete len:83 (-) Transcript_28565:763-1011(-)
MRNQSDQLSHTGRSGNNLQDAGESGTSCEISWAMAGTKRGNDDGTSSRCRRTDSSSVSKGGGKESKDYSGPQTHQRGDTSNK